MVSKRDSLWTSVTLAIFMMALIWSYPGSARASIITDDLKSVIDQVIKIVQDPAYTSDRAKRREKMRGLIDPKFNYEEMGKRSLGKEDWLQRTSDEQRMFVDLFGKLLENSYASKIESYQDEKIEYGDEIVKGNYAMVKTKIVRKDDTINVDYKLINDGNRWQVYDFVIEEVSMIRNYRSQFSKIIRKDSFQVLMDKMSKKVADLEKGGKDSDNL